MPARASRAASSFAGKFSLVRNTALWFRTRSGPPPMAFVTPVHDDGRIRRTVTEVSLCASFSSFAASVPLATSTAPSDGIWVGPAPTATTFAVRSVFGVVAGNGWRTTVVAFGRSGVVAPQDGVNSIVWLPLGLWLIPASGRRWPDPFQVPTNEN